MKNYQEIKILSTDLKNIFNPIMIDYLCRSGYNETGLKFWLSFNGSKGYFSHISIDCEITVSIDNRLFSHELFNKNGSIKKKLLNVFYSKKNGIRLSLGKDKERKIISGNNEASNTSTDEDLPF